VAASAANPAAAAPGQNPAPDPAPLLAAADLNPPGAVVAPAADALPLLAALPANAAAPDGTAPVAEAKLNAPPGSADFARELGARLSTFVRDGVEHARLELNPQAMGPVTVQIQLEGANAQVSLSAEHAATRRALEQALPQLAATLREAGLMLSGGGVFEQQRPPQEGRDNTGHTGTARGTARAGSAGEAAVPGVAAGAWPPRSRGVVDLVA
jgi:flagellar hook-length control protein FliK